MKLHPTGTAAPFISPMLTVCETSSSLFLAYITSQGYPSYCQTRSPNASTNMTKQHQSGEKKGMDSNAAIKTLTYSWGQQLPKCTTGCLSKWENTEPNCTSSIQNDFKSARGVSTFIRMYADRAQIILVIVRTKCR